MLDHEIRARGVGGSEVAAILGLDSRRDAFSVWLDKKGLSEREPPTPLMHLGKLMEKAIAEYYSIASGRPIEWIDETRVHPDRPWHIYTVDALCTNELRGVDAKLVLGAYHEWGDDPDAVPVRVNLQARWYMAALEYPYWDIMAVVGASPRIYTIRRDLEIEDAVLRAVENFYTRHLLTNEPPAPGPSPATTRYLKERFRDHSALVRTASPAEAELLEQYAQARQEFSEVEKAKQTLTNQLCLAIAGDAGVRTDDCTLTWKQIKDSEGVDWPKLATKLMEGFTDERRGELMDAHAFTKFGYRRIHFTDRRKD